MQIRPVRDWQEALIAARIRNECREFMTGDQTVIDARRQAAWWRENQRRPNVRLYLGLEGTAPRAFGLIRPGGVITGGVARAARGRGLGRELFAYLTAAAEKPAHLDVLASNEAAIALYGSLGWEQVDERDGTYGPVIAMVHA